MKLAACFFIPLFLLGQQSTDAPCFVSGRVITGAKGEPVRHARLFLRHADDAAGSTSSAAYTTMSDEQGRFAMQNIEPGNYDFTAEHTGFVPNVYGARRPGRPGITVSLTAGQQLTGVVFRMVPQAVITGRILDLDGEPVQGVQVSTVHYQYRMGHRQLMPTAGFSTNDLGEYRLFGLAPGRYYLRATYRNTAFAMQMNRAAGKQPEDSYVPTYYPGVTDIGTAGLVELAVGTQLRGLDFICLKARSASVRGHVILPEGMHKQSAFISLSPRSQTFFDLGRRARVDGQGAFELRGVTPGSYILVAMAHGGTETYSARQPVEVGDTSLEGITVTLSLGEQLSGELRFEGQAPPTAAGVEVFLEAGDTLQSPFLSPPSGEAKDDGSFTIANISRYLYRVRVNHLPEGYYLKSVRHGDDELIATGIDATRELSGSLLLTISSRAGRIEGKVLNARDQPVPGAAVVLVPEAKQRDRSEAFKHVTTDQYGRYTLRTVEPGEYKLFAWEDMEPGEYVDPEFLKPVESRGLAMSIREGARESADLKVIAAPGQGRTARPAQ